MDRLERVARAICREVIGSYNLSDLVSVDTTNEDGRPLWQSYTQEAQAAIDAMSQWQPIETAPKVCMYLFIYEDGAIETSERITAEDWVANAEGLVDFVDIRNPEKPLLYSHGVWSEIESAVSNVADR